MKKNSPMGIGKEDPGQGLDLLNLGWLIAGNMAVSVVGGLWLDRHFKTAPILLLIGVFVGFFACGYTIYRAVKKIERDEAAKPQV